MPSYKVSQYIVLLLSLLLFMFDDHAKIKGIQQELLIYKAAVKAKGLPRLVLRVTVMTLKAENQRQLCR